MARETQFILAALVVLALVAWLVRSRAGRGGNVDPDLPLRIEARL